MAPGVPVRLGKLLRERTGLPLAKLEGDLNLGRIEVDGEPARGLRQLVFEGDEVTLDGLELPPPAAPRYYLLNKPRGITTTTASPDLSPDLSAWLNSLPAGVFPVGRLDRDSSGLLLLTSDGDLAYALLSPDHHVKKSYRVAVRASRPLSESQLRCLEGPTRIGDQVLSAERVEVESEGGGQARLLFVLQEGKHRQIRRMCKAAGVRVISLERIAIGDLPLADLPVGGLRELSSFECERLWANAGGKSLVQKRQLAALVALSRQGRASGEPDLRLEQWLERWYEHAGWSS